MGLLTGLLTACSGFLLAVLWMDLIFDTQIRGDQQSALPSIAGYYRRATTTSQPMGRLIAAVMVVLLGVLAVEAFVGDSPGWLIAVSALLASGPVTLALTRTVPNAVRLGRRTDTVAEQARLARAIYRDHLVCAVSMLAFLVLWLAWLGR
ncbi:hypothetical protein H7J51_02185 [Mycobacterium crocinum]|uniref:DUF1772 domain-containing protein n=1 Tax=Mycolicibacterium crocinum TaxID=388459 RepID=A0ABY3TD55_9MYCO|nr:hypothetical protein [Mycolicibacterium crocinum]MCV7214090.1 hypothetical protein [Mycolicibacterium crocinum]ULN39363.1 hypothetical protein MI149_16515 [Mycolicibacterium crocinum]